MPPPTRTRTRTYTPTHPLRLGILTPSSNTALEPLTTTLLTTSPTLPPTTAHFTRIPVTTISLSTPALSQFNHPTMLAAAHLLASAHVDVIAWSGVSAGWLGFETDEELCKAITAETGGIPCTTATLALNKALGLLGGVRRVGMVTPFVREVQEAVVGNYKEGLGVECVVEGGLCVEENVRIAEVGVEELDGAVERVVREAGDGEGVDAIVIFCTNLRSADRAGYWEGVYGVPVLDTVSTVVWDMLRLCGVETEGVEGWGRIMKLK
ncbi:hypothetical protein FQN50_007701 [Emmonsiellopsis sp. PD_5]|nr:hypothetical protein FQN50_007701 [Emmonsiellopsis sp. PD_5]